MKELKPREKQCPDQAHTERRGHGEERSREKKGRAEEAGGGEGLSG